MLIHHVQSALQQISFVRPSFLCILLCLTCGCVSPGVTQKPAEVASGPWTVSAKGAAPYGVSFTIGPFQTSAMGILQSKAARQQPKPELETVQFINNKVLYMFDINHASGAKATVRAGIEDTGKITQSGFLKTRKRDTTAGSVSKDGRIVGEFSIRHLPPSDSGSNSDDSAGIQDGSVTTSLGTIKVKRRYESPPPATSIIGAIMQPADDRVDEYHLGDRIVASRRGLRTSTAHIDPNLPLDVQFCIAAAMTIPLHKQSMDETAASASMFSASSARLVR